MDRYGDFPWRREPVKGFTQELGTLRPALQKLLECGLRKRSLRTLSRWEDPALVVEPAERVWAKARTGERQDRCC